MQNYHFRLFMTEIVHALEPQKFLRGAEIVKEMDTVGEINFVYNGTVGIGFEINK